MEAVSLLRHRQTALLTLPVGLGAIASLLFPLLFPPPGLAFTDTGNHWAGRCIADLQQRGLVTGYPDGSFRPDGLVTRAEAAVLMLNAFPEVPRSRSPLPYRDVPPAHWAHNAIQTASAKGFFTGYPGQIFQPSQAIPRIQALSILVRDGEPNAWPLARYFDDADQIPSYAQRAIALATRQTYVVNYPEPRQLRPNQATARGDMAAFLCRALNIAAVPSQYLAGVVTQPYDVRPLPGQLNRLPFFNSNSPELVRREGILLSTFAKQGKASPEAHLDYGFTGSFGLFSHHLTRADQTSELSPPFYQGILVHNPGPSPVTLDIRAAASYLASPEAPFITLGDQSPNSDGKVFSGPGDRVTQAILQGLRQPLFPETLVLAPGESQMLLNQPIPISRAPASNGRSTLMQLASDGPVYLADLALRSAQPPSLADWQRLLEGGSLAQPRDAVPTPLDPPRHPTVFSRVAGVSLGDRWVAELVDVAGGDRLTLPAPGRALAYPIATLPLITLSTGQIQSAPMVRRYADTAFLAHSNYGVEYDLTLPLLNSSDRPQQVAIALESPLKDEGGRDRLLFLDPPDGQIFFRGTVEIEFRDRRDCSASELIWSSVGDSQEPPWSAWPLGLARASRCGFD